MNRKEAIEETKKENLRAAGISPVGPLRKNIVFPYGMQHRDQIDLEEAIARSSAGVWGGEDDR